MHKIRILILSLMILLSCALALNAAPFLHGASVGVERELTSAVSPEPLEMTVSEPDPFPEITAAPVSSPSVTATASPKVPARDFAPLQRQMAKYLNNSDGHFGVSFIDLESSKRFGIRDSESFIAASTYKLPINLALYQLAARKEIRLDTRVTYRSEDDYEDGTGDMQGTEDGESFTLADLSSRSIRISDNIAINMIVRHLGYDRVKDLMSKAVGHPVDFENNRATPRDMASWMRATWQLSAKSAVARPLMEHLENTIYNDRIPRDLPEGTKIAHKIGNHDGAWSDVGLIFASHPFVLAVMSSETDEDTAREVIANLAQMAWNFEN